MLELKDKLNLLWKFLFLSIFAYGVISITCAINCGSGCGGCKSQCQVDKACCSSKSTPCTKSISKCAAGCTKPCCDK